MKKLEMYIGHRCPHFSIFNIKFWDRRLDNRTSYRYFFFSKVHNKTFKLPDNADGINRNYCHLFSCYPPSVLSYAWTNEMDRQEQI